MLCTWIGWRQLAKRRPVEPSDPFGDLIPEHLGQAVADLIAIGSPRDDDNVIIGVWGTSCWTPTRPNLEGVAESKADVSQQNVRSGQDDAFSDGLAAVVAMLDDNI